jgi:hypothetical protein
VSRRMPRSDLPNAFTSNCDHDPTRRLRSTAAFDNGWADARYVIDHSL